MLRKNSAVASDFLLYSVNQVFNFDPTRPQRLARHFNIDDSGVGESNSPLGHFLETSHCDPRALTNIDAGLETTLKASRSCFSVPRFDDLRDLAVDNDLNRLQWPGTVRLSANLDRRRRWVQLEAVSRLLARRLLHEAWDRS